ncbi:hypothetical protein G6F56_005258 [Rhizopus delemar]|nr:hypothetical protein G6F56_005258 [Rhizopus delemar]
MNDERYNNILQMNFIFGSLNFTRTLSSYAKWWKESLVIRVFEYWPAQSPDLSPIEHVWWDLEKRLTSKRDQVKDTAQLKALIQQEWPQISLGLAEVLVGIFDLIRKVLGKQCMFENQTI